MLYETQNWTLLHDKQVNVSQKKRKKPPLPPRWLKRYLCQKVMGKSKQSGEQQSPWPTGELEPPVLGAYLGDTFDLAQTNQPDATDFPPVYMSTDTSRISHGHLLTYILYTSTGSKSRLTNWNTHDTPSAVQGPNFDSADMGSGAAPRRIRSETLTPEESETELRHATTLNAWGLKKADRLSR